MNGRRYIYKALRTLIIALYIFSVLPGTATSACRTALGEQDGVVSGYEENGNDDSGKQVSSRFLELFLSSGTGELPTGTGSTKYYIGGEAFGVKLSGVGVKVLRTTDFGDSPLHADDRIIKINGLKISSVDEVKKILGSCSGGNLLLEIEREGNHCSISVKPTYNGSEYNLGVVLTDSAAGIGTLTYITDTGEFGGLGHGISDGSDGGVLPMSSGNLTSVILAGAKKSENGKPGELRGILGDDNTAAVLKNTECGIFGVATQKTVSDLCCGEPVELGGRNEVHTGDATIFCTTAGTEKCEYSVRIERIDRGATSSKCFRIKITDKDLLAKTGGIVRGMSGSPIIQDGKLVGAVTHVLVANPTEGYGIFIENMISAAQNKVIPKAA